MRFTKMQGCGNDYIYVNAMEERVESPGRLAKAVSDRHFGIGADGLILGLARLFTLRPGADTLTAFSCLFALADALTMGRLTPERQGLPYCVAAGLSLFFTLWGTYSKRQGLRMACRLE